MRTALAKAIKTLDIADLERFEKRGTTEKGEGS
jgi:hypothetical protein